MQHLQNVKNIIRVTHSHKPEVALKTHDSFNMQRSRDYNKMLCDQKQRSVFQFRAKMHDTHMRNTCNLNFHLNLKQHTMCPVCREEAKEVFLCEYLLVFVCVIERKKERERD